MTVKSKKYMNLFTLAKRYKESHGKPIVKGRGTQNLHKVKNQNQGQSSIPKFCVKIVSKSVDMHKNCECKNITCWNWSKFGYLAETA